VLVIDDDASVRTVVGQLVEFLGYEPLLAADGPAGLAIIEAAGPRLAAVLLDLTMPLMLGDEVARRIAASHPGLPVVLMSGNLNTPGAPDVSGLPVVAVLTKPFALRQLRALLSQIIPAP
jgi:CheY-like chemotaxis protein